MILFPQLNKTLRNFPIAFKESNRSALSLSTECTDETNSNKQDFGYYIDVQDIDPAEAVTQIEKWLKHLPVSL
jgi:hypothetical protein